MTRHYQGSCHCGAIRFSFDAEEINQGLRCTCSICTRKGALMSAFAIPNDELNIEADEKDIGLYQFGSKIAKHYFCKTCGIYTHNETIRAPGNTRVNLGCVDGIDISKLEIVVFDGKNLL